MLTRWQLIALAGLLCFDFVPRIGTRSWRQWKLLAVFLAGTMIAMSPQLIAWRILWGDWVLSVHSFSKNWFHPDLHRVLFSMDRGLFTWTPLTIVACAGMIVAFLQPRVSGFRMPRNQVAFLFAIFAFQVYALASITGKGVFLGSAYGYRQLTESVLLLTPGLAYLFQTQSRIIFRVFLTMATVTSIYNLLLIGAYYYGMIPNELEKGSMLTISAVVGFFLKRTLKAALLLIPVGILLGISWRNDLVGSNQAKT
ncbi:MAG: hypothetical protein U0798_09550 [Gemmataceae bacterium]